MDTSFWAFLSIFDDCFKVNYIYESNISNGDILSIYFYNHYDHRRPHHLNEYSYDL